MSITTAVGRPRRLLVAGAALAAALTLSACSGSSAPAQSPTGQVVETDLKISAVSAPNSLDPAQLADGQQMFVWSSVLDTLLAKENNTGELIPNAATAWEYNEDGSQLTLTIREGMTFSTGDPVDAHAVVATMQRTKDTAGIQQQKYAAVNKIEATDDYTVVITFDQYDPQFLPNLALGAGAIGDPATLDDERTATDPVGSGPFVLDTAKSVPGSSYVLTKRDDYWNADAVPFKTFTVTVIQDPTAAFNAFQSGELNSVAVQPQMEAQLASDVTKQEVSAQALFFLNILDRGGEKWPALGDIRVRQALNHAIDREAVVKSLLQGAGAPAEQSFSPAGPVYDESLNGTYPYDPAKGKQLVAEAGYAGETFQIPSTFLSATFEPTISQAFTDIGLAVEWVSVPPQQAQSAQLSGDYGITFQIGGFSSPASEAYANFGPDGYGNPRGYTNDELAGFFDEISSNVDFDAALPAYKALNAYAVEQAYEVPIATTNSVVASKDGIVMLDDGTSAVCTYRLYGVSE